MIHFLTVLFVGLAISTKKLLGLGEARAAGLELH